MNRSANIEVLRVSHFDQELYSKLIENRVLKKNSLICVVTTMSHRNHIHVSRGPRVDTRLLGYSNNISSLNIEVT